MARKVLVSLVSAQTIPNIEFINEFKEEVDYYVFISTEFMERQQMDRTNCTIVGSDLNKQNTEMIIVQEDSIIDINTELSKLDPNDEYIINLTGGTKIMSIATYNFFIDKDAQIYYKPIRTNKIISLNDESTFKEVKAEIGVISYLKSYGIGINKKTNLADFINREVTEKIFDLFLNGHINLKIIEKLRTVYRSKRKEYNIYDIEQTEDDKLKIKDLSFFMEKIGFSDKTNENSIITKKEISYLTGGWFEEFTYFYFKEKLDLNDSEIELGVHLKKSENVLDNDLDVVFTYNNNLYVVECKTAMSLNGEVSSKLFNETIYKASALRAKFGLSVKNLLLTLSNMTNPQINYIDKASVMNIRLYDRKYFVDMSKFDELINTIKKTY